MRPSRLRKTVKLSRTIQQHLNQYALSACATGVSALAWAQPTQAEIVYTPAHKSLPVNRLFYLDLNHDGRKDFKFFLQSEFGSGYWFTDLKLEGVQTKNEVWSFVSSSFRFGCAAALPKGTKVTSQSPFGQGYRFMFYGGSSFGGAGSFCPWLSFKQKEPAYLGLKFLIKGKIHFGWARFANIHSGHQPPSAELTGYAYETVPNKTIITGKTKGPDVIMLQPASLGRLAAGVSAIPVRRVKQTAETTH
jgi:hypothetical protein